VPGGINITSCSGSHLSAPAAKPLGSGGNVTTVDERLCTIERNRQSLHERGYSVTYAGRIFAEIEFGGVAALFLFVPFHGGRYGD
jgi:hypothetical protein